MTSRQQDAERTLVDAECGWLLAYGWKFETSTGRWSHEHAPKARSDYERRDALQMTRAEKLRYGGPIR